MLEPTNLGASLYVPVTHPDLASIAASEKLTEVRSIIFCTEDAVAPRDLATGMFNLAKALDSLRPSGHRQFFVRVRSPEILKQVLTMPGIAQLNGFVLPKVTADNLDFYLDLLSPYPHCVMPTLETREVFNEAAMQDLLRLIDKPNRRERILCLRIGGNDLLAQLRMRRPRNRTIYETPIGYTIARLATTFIPYGFSLSAPVFEHLDDEQTLINEIEIDLNHGLVGKTAIHPSQISLIEGHYRVRQQDLDAAMCILSPDAAGVFKLHQSMCEPATLRPWAKSVLNAARCFGGVSVS
jgi:citrate lyase beta subunit